MGAILAVMQLDTAAQVGIGLVGGLALFLYGMDKMSDALRAAAGDGMKQLLATLTKNRFTASFTGAIVTAVIQSSSVTTVLVVGFITAGLLTLQQSVGIIMGANVGTTVTAQILAFRVTNFALALVAIGFAALWFARREQFRQYGAILMGLGLIFLGMEAMSDATRPLREYQPVIELMQRMDSPLWGILIGALFTALVQSSSAATGIVIVLASQGFVSLEAGIALALGANIGTCVTSLLAAMGKPVEAVRAAVVHVLFNVLGVLIWLPFIPQLAEVARWLSPAYADLAGVDRLAAEAPRQIANANTFFNVANTLVLIWFTGPIASLAVRLVRERPAVRPPRVEPKFLDVVYLQTSALALDRVRLELGRLGQCVVRMLDAAPPAVMEGTRRELIRVRDMDEDVDSLYSAIVDYLRKLARHELSTAETHRLEDLLSIANHLESIGDLIETNLVAEGLHRLDVNLRLSPGTREVIQPLYQAVSDSLRDALQSLSEEDRELAMRVVARKGEIERLATIATNHLGRRLLADEPRRIEAFSLESDIISQIKRLYYFAKRIAKVLAGEEGRTAEAAENNLSKSDVTP